MKGTRHGSATVEFPNDHEVLITRQFDAPAELVFDALTKPEHVRAWFGPRSSRSARSTSASAGRITSWAW